MRQDEFKNRYIIKVASSILIAALNTIIQLIIPRVFSVEEYGYYTYNLNVFTSIVVMANLSASNAFIAKYSKRNDEVGLIYFYLKFFGLVALVLNVAITLLYQFAAFRSAFAGQTFLIIILGIETSIVIKLLSDCIMIYDASAISRFPAIMQIVLKVLICGAVICGYIFGILNLAFFYIIQIGSTLLIVLILIYAILKDQKRRYPEKIVYPARKYINEFYVYCKPLVFSTIVSQIVVVIMNWALMKWSGATEQAMFGAAWQLNTLVSYVFSPYAELSKREFAIVYDKAEQLKERFERSLRLMIWLTSYFAIFIAFASDWILPIVYGDKYSSAGVVTILIMFYTIYQAWGQITGAYMLSVEKTKASAMISIVGQFMTLGFVFLFQIPNFIWTDSLGAIGIALNYLTVNVISAMVSICYISRTLKVSSMKMYLIQFPPLIFCTAVTVLLKLALDCIMADSYVLLKTIIAGIIYTVVCAGLFYIKPQLLGVSREGLRNIIKRRK